MNKSSEDSKYQVDENALSATITSNGVVTLSFWLGDMGYGPLISQLKKEEELKVIKVKEGSFKSIFSNPIALQILGICSALAVTGSLYITLMC